MKKPRPVTRRRPLTIPDCKNFTGYKPCFPDTTCYTGCVSPAPTGTRILIVNLDAMGNVLVTTSLLPALKRKYPTSTITWITLANAAPLLAHHPMIDRVEVWNPEAWLVLGELRWDLVLNVDKSRRSCAFTMTMKAKTKLGFGLNERGAVVPLNREARENYILGLDDRMKFKVNQKTVPQLQHGQFRLRYRHDPYKVYLTPDEEEFVRSFRRQAGIGDRELVVGLNTGCSELYPNKKMTVEQHVALIHRLAGITGIRLVLLGGPEDTLRNAEISRQVGDAAIPTPTTEGVRRGLAYVALCDLVISGDSFGMHAAVALGKHVIVWFGVSSAPEIELFGGGLKLVPEGLACSPCWKQKCPYNLECIAMIDLEKIIGYVMGYQKSWVGRRV